MTWLYRKKNKKKYESQFPVYKNDKIKKKKKLQKKN